MYVHGYYLIVTPTFAIGILLLYMLAMNDDNPLHFKKKKLEPIIPAVGSTGQVDGSSMISALAVDYDS